MKYENGSRALVGLEYNPAYIRLEKHCDDNHYQFLLVTLTQK